MDYSLAVGIDDYIHLSATPYAENDARGFHDVMKTVFNVQHAELILGKHATYKNIEFNFKKIEAKIDTHDRLLFFFAGHGQNIKGIPHISCYDTNGHDESTWHDLFTLMETINATGCNKLIFFIDACESTIKLGSRKKSIDRFSLSEITAYIKRTSYSCVFSATSHKGVADIIPDKKHGIWSFFLLKALRGEEPKALKDEHLLTNHSLQTFLNISVLKHCKTSTIACDIQLSYKWGKEEGEFLINDFKGKAVIEYKRIPASSIKRVEFVTITTNGVKKLSGFRSGRHHLPKYYTEAVDRFINDIARDEIKEHMEDVSRELRTLLKLRARDFSVEYGENCGFFECPYLKYSYCVEIDQDELDTVSFTGTLIPIEISKIIEVSKGLDACFPTWFSYLLYTLSKSINVEELINRIEEADTDKLEDFEYDYNSRKTSLELSSKKLKRDIIVRATEIEIHFNAKEAIPQMLESLKDLSNQIALIFPKYRLLD
jgi:hypothetical protein